MKEHFLLVLSLVLSLAACQQAHKQSVSNSGMPPPDGKTLWNYITIESPYKTWPAWPGVEGIYEGKSPHGAYLKLYANDLAIRAAGESLPSQGETPAKEITLPPGSILVKENYAEDRKTLAAVTPMYKIEHYNPAGGDWFWAKYGSSGELMVSGKVEACIDCHKAAHDYRLTKDRFLRAGERQTDPPELPINSQRKK